MAKVEVEKPEDVRDLARKWRRELENLRRAWVAWHEARDLDRAVETAKLYLGYAATISLERAALTLPGVKVEGAPAPPEITAAPPAAKPPEKLEVPTEELPTGYTVTFRLLINLTKTQASYTDVVGISLVAQKRVTNKTVYEWDSAGVELRNPILYVGGEKHTLKPGTGVLGRGDMAKTGLAWSPPRGTEGQEFIIYGEGTAYYATAAGARSAAVKSPTVTLKVIPVG